MDRPHVNLHYERDFPYPVDVAYAWLTDYVDDDHERAGAIIRRRTVAKKELDAKGRPVLFELDGELETFGQSTGRGIAVVRLWPDEKRWQAEIGKGAWVYEYRLVPTPKGSRIVIDYRFGSRRWRKRALITITKPLIRREIDKMWDGFAAAMAREIPSSTGVAVPSRSRA